MSNRKQKAIINIQNEEFLSGFYNALIKNKQVKLTGIGIFALKKIDSRVGVNPRTLKSMEIKGHTRIKFRASSKLKALVN